MPAFYDSGFTYDSGATFSEFLRTSFAFGTNGTVGARGKLIGVANLRFSTQAKLIGELSASGQTKVTFSSTPKLLGKYAATGSVVISFAETTGFISKAGRVKAAVTVKFSSDPLLTGRANALGNPVLTTVVQPARMYAVGKLETTDTTTFNPFGPGKARGKLVGRNNFSFSSSAKLKGRGILKGVPSVTRFTTLSRLEIKVPIFTSTKMKFSSTAHLRISPFEGSKSTGALSPHGFSEGRLGLLYESTSGLTPNPYSSTEE